MIVKINENLRDQFIEKYLDFYQKQHQAQNPDFGLEREDVCYNLSEDYNSHPLFNETRAKITVMEKNMLIAQNLEFLKLKESYHQYCFDYDRQQSNATPIHDEIQEEVSIEFYIQTSGGSYKYAQPQEAIEEFQKKNPFHDKVIGYQWTDYRSPKTELAIHHKDGSKTINDLSEEATKELAGFMERIRAGSSSIITDLEKNLEKIEQQETYQSLAFEMDEEMEIEAIS